MAEDKPFDLRERTKAFALRVIRLCASLPDTTEARVVRTQLVRSGTSVGANCRAAKRAKSRPDFISKLGTVEEELDESMYWMERAAAAGMVPKPRLDNLYREADELLAIVVASVRTARRSR